MPATINDLPDQQGRIAVVTGANSGIGLEAARELARAGAGVLACRDTAQGGGRRRDDPREVPAAELERRLARPRLAGVGARVRRRLLRHDRLDLLINNAGVMAAPYRTTVDGFELQFGTNHLGHFALTGLLLDRAPRDARGRASSPSAAPRTSSARIDFDDLQSERSYRRWRAYGSRSSPTCCSRSSSTAACARATPTCSASPPTRLRRHQPAFAATPSRVERLGSMSSTGRTRRAPSAARSPTLYAATADIPGGSFVGPDGFQEMRGAPTLVKPTRAARDPETARRLWEISEELTGVRFAFDGTADAAVTASAPRA